MASRLCFGDAIFCEFLRENPAPGGKSNGGYDDWGFISADVTRSGQICMEKGSIDTPPVDIGGCLWTVEPLHQNCACRELRVHMHAIATIQAALDRTEKSSSKLIEKSDSAHGLAMQADEDVLSYKNRLKDLDKLTIQFKDALAQEIRYNAKLALRRKGDPIAFGQPVSTHRCVCKCGRSCLFYSRWNGCVHVRCDDVATRCCHCGRVFVCQPTVDMPI